MVPQATKSENLDTEKATADNISIINEDDLIEMVNDLQDKLSASGHSLDVSLPQIVVVGCQSAGKSSVLENIVGREFLPRGTGVVTRRPTIIQLQPYDSEYAVFLHKPDEKFTDFKQVQAEIKRKTLEDLGERGFSSDPINLKIYSPNVLKLTLVDLPGLIKVVMGDMPETMIDELREMIRSYISQPKSLILAVTPANQDIANSDALSIAKTVDPNRERTIGVLTKLDIMDEGSDARDILENKVLPLKRGYVGVVNRSQKDIEDNRDIQYILEKERRYFKEKPCYSHLAHRMGTPYLQKLLHKQLRAHIQEHLPVVRNELGEKYTALSQELAELNEKIGEDVKVGKQVIMLKLIHRFINSLTLTIMGQSEMVNVKEISHGAHINYLFYTEIQKFLNLQLEPDRDELTVAIANIPGLRTEISVASLSFDAICRRLIEQYKAPLVKSVEIVTKIFNDAIEDTADKELKLYPSLKNEVLYRVSTQVKHQASLTKERLDEHIEAEKFFFNIGHPDFESSILDQVAPQAGPVKIWDVNMPENVQSTSNEPVSAAKILRAKLQSNEATQKKVSYISAMICKYLEIVRKNVGDVVIKYMAYFLIQQVLEYVKIDLPSSLMSSGNVDSLMMECDDDFRRKEELEGNVAVIKRALDAIQKF